jgi:hypothetical protein
MRTATRSTHRLLKTIGFGGLNSHIFKFPPTRREYMLISNIRNPYSRMVSLFYIYSVHKERFDLNFENWCEYAVNDEEFDYRYQLRYESIIKSTGRSFDKFIRIESYSEDLKTLSFIDLSKPETQEVWNNSILKNRFKNEFKFIETDGRKSWFDFYNQKLADLVFNKLEEQFNLFGYDRNSWKNGTP